MQRMTLNPLRTVEQPAKSPVSGSPRQNEKDLIPISAPSNGWVIRFWRNAWESSRSTAPPCSLVASVAEELMGGSNNERADRDPSHPNRRCSL